MARLERREGFVRSPEQRANFTRMACDYEHGVMAAAYVSAQRIKATAGSIAQARFGREGGYSEYADSFTVARGPIISIEGQRRGSWRVLNYDELASLIELGPKNPGPRPQGGFGPEAEHILYRAALAHSGSTHRPA